MKTLTNLMRGAKPRRHSAVALHKHKMAKIKFRSVLAPIDFSEPSKRSLKRALSFAREFGATLTLLNVVAPPLADPTYTPGQLMAKNGQEVLEAATTALIALKREHGADGRLIKHTIVRLGSPVDQIISVARKGNFDLIIIATHGRTGLKRFFLGSTAERVVRYAPCPVLIVRNNPGNSEAQSGKSRWKIKRILVPLDFSENSLTALKYANPLAHRFKAEQTLLSVVHPPYDFTTSEFTSFDHVELLNDSYRSTRKQMAGLIARERSKRLRIRPLVLKGHPITEIVSIAKKHHIDLIVLSTHGRTGLGRVLLGSTAENVVRHAPCSVLAAREKERDLITR